MSKGLGAALKPTSRYNGVALFQRILIFLIFVGLIVAQSFGHKSQFFDDTHKVLVPPPRNIDQFSFGFDEVIADSLWIRLLQDISGCGRKEQDIQVVTGEEEVAEAIQGAQFRARCEYGWSYRMLDAITKLAPRFRTAYLQGVTFLSVIVDDKLGAAKLFKRAVEVFPQDWTMHYRAGYHFLIEMNDAATGADMLAKAARLGAPMWVHALAARLYTGVGRAALAISILESILRTADEKLKPNVRKRLELRLEEAKAALRSSHSN